MQVNERHFIKNKIIQMSNKIKHSGIVDSVDGDMVRVRILQSSACSACKVASHCNASETKEKIIEVNDSHATDYVKGDSVVVVTDTSVGYRASLYGYLLPLVVMVATLVAVLGLTHSEGMAAVAALVVLIPYYIVLYMFRGKLKQRLSFEIEKY